MVSELTTSQLYSSKSNFPGFNEKLVTFLKRLGHDHQDLLLSSGPKMLILSGSNYDILVTFDLFFS